MSKKMIILLVVLLSLGIVFSYFAYHYYKASNSIHEYMDKQGIKKKDIVVEDFNKDWKQGGYWYCVSIKGEDSNIYYKYQYQDAMVYFSAYHSRADVIQKKTWGGNGLTSDELKDLKYPPLK
ncbi:DUF3139 domain-containing protein [Bacillus thuringiensis]|uniref:DUF3139 domain-containing protein n=1 Tax=Bacillus thuringiensis TaxID=1428 RepID=UPI000CD9AB82|nr:DUF3139 domain-containing protein [Bacillus thuringiensis]